MGGGRREEGGGGELGLRVIGGGVDLVGGGDGGSIVGRHIITDDEREN